MNTNKLLTYLLYALLAGLIAVAGYKTWQTKQRSTQLAKEEAEFQQSLRDLGYVENDTTGSQYEGEENPNGSSSVVITDGIEDEIPVTTTPAPQPKAGTPKTSTPPASPPKAGTSKTNTPSAGTSNTPAPAPKKTAPAEQAEPRNLDTDNSDGRYRVVAGSFTKMEGARREMERIIKMGYHDAEVGHFNRSKYAVVVVKRTNSLSEATKIVDALARKGIDAAVIDRERRK
jgi:cell division protein FtsN